MALGANSTATAANSVALGTSSAAARGAQTGYTAAYLSAPQTSSGEVSVGSSGAERQITHVAAGSAGTDAVNVSQLHGAVASMQGDIQNEFRNEIKHLGSQIDAAKDLARSAAALGLAAAQIRYDDRPGRFSFGVGGGAFQGHGAVAIGLGYTSPDQHWRANVSGGIARGSDAGIGAGLSFTLN